MAQSPPGRGWLAVQCRPGRRDMRLRTCEDGGQGTQVTLRGSRIRGSPRSLPSGQCLPPDIGWVGGPGTRSWAWSGPENSNP